MSTWEFSQATTLDANLFCECTALFPPQSQSLLCKFLSFWGLMCFITVKSRPPTKESIGTLHLLLYKTEISEQCYIRYLYVIACSTFFWTGVRDRFSFPLFSMLSCFLLS